VVSWVRNHFSIKKVGHTGTLDPMATGVIVLCLGAYTRLSSFVTDSQKVYRAVIRFGAKTDTLDADGTITKRSDSLPFDRCEVESALAGFVGPITQVPPMYSAIKMKGRRLYDLARKGVEVERSARQVNISRLDVVAYHWPLLHITVGCSKGTYIRSLADDLGRRLGCGGYLVTLRRTGVGDVALHQCLTMQDLRSFEVSGTISDAFIDPHAVLQDVPSVSLTRQQYEPFLHGNPVSGLSEKLKGTVRVLSLQDELLGIGQMENGVLKPQRVISNR
jgi:tRNA pseudouridine55 synthase